MIGDYFCYANAIMINAMNQEVIPPGGGGVF